MNPIKEDFSVLNYFNIPPETRSCFFKGGHVDLDISDEASITAGPIASNSSCARPFALSAKDRLSALDYLELEKQADREALETDFTDTFERREYFERVVEKYEQAAKAAFIQADAEKTLSLFRKAAALSIKKVDAAGIDSMQRAVQFLEEKGEREILACLYSDLLKLFDQQIDRIPKYHSGYNAFCILIGKADLLGKMGICPDERKTLYKQAADRILSQPRLVERPTNPALLAAILYEKAGLDPKSFYGCAMEEIKNGLEELTSAIDDLLIAMEEEVEIFGDSELMVGAFYLCIFYSLQARMFQCAAHQLGDKQAWLASLEKEFFYWERCFLKPFSILIANEPSAEERKESSSSELSGEFVGFLSQCFGLGDFLISQDDLDLETANKIRGILLNYHEIFKSIIPETADELIKKRCESNRELLESFFGSLTDKSMEEILQILNHIGGEDLALS